MRFLLFLLLFLLSATASQSQTCSPIFQCGSLPVSGGTPQGSPTFFCEGDTVIIENNAQSDVDSTFFNWGDGVIERFKGRVNGSHIYDLPDTLCLSGGDTLVSIPITLTVLKICPSGISRNCVITFVSIQVKPTVRFNNIDDLCVNKPITFSNSTCQNGATATYLWTFDGGASTTDKEPTYTFTTPGWHKVKLCATNNCGTNCLEKDIFIKEAASISNVAVAMMPNPPCVPAEVKFTPTFSNVNDWVWSVLPANCPGCWEWVGSNADSLMPTVRFKKPGDYTMRLIVWNECGRDTLDTPITIFDVPSVSFSPTSLSGCNTLTVNFANNNLVSFNGSITTYLWEFPNGTTSNEQYPVRTFTQSGVVKLTVTGPCGSQMAQMTVNINQQIPVQFGPVPSPLCLSSDTFTIPVLVMQNPQLFTGPGIVNGQTGLFDPSKASIGQNTITYTHGASGCESTGTLIINILDSTAVDVGGTHTLCEDAGVYTIPFSPTGGKWTGPGITDEMLGLFDPLVAGPGSHNPKYTYVDPITGCTTVKFKTITIVALPTAGVVPDTLHSCYIPTAVNVQSLATFSFLPPAPGSTLVFSGANISSNGMFTSPGIGLFQATATYAIPPGCSDAVDFWIQVDSFVMASAGPAQQVCTSQGILTLVGTPQGQGTWAPVGSAPPIDPQTGEIDLNTAATGPWQYRYTINTGTPCESSSLADVKIVPGAGVQTPAVFYACDTDLSATLPPALPLSGIWSNNDGIPINGNQIDISNVGPDTFLFVYTVDTLPDACNHDTTRLIIVPDVNPAFNTSHDTACIGQTAIQFTPAVAGQGKYIWDFGDGTSSMLEAPVKTYLIGGTYTITLTVQSLNPLSSAVLCENSSNYSVHVIAAPQLLAFSATPTEGCASLTVQFSNQSIVEHGNFWWDFGNGTSFSGEHPGPVTYEQGREDTVYIAQLFATNGCDTVVFEQAITVKALPTPVIEYSYLQPCSGDTLILTNLSYGSPDSSIWRDSEGWFFTGKNPPIRKYYTADSMPRVVTIWLRVLNECGERTDSVQITVNPADVFAAAFISDTSKVCLGDTVRLKNISPDGIPRWLDKYGQEWAAPEIAIVATEVGEYWITLYVHGCGYDSVNLHYYVRPIPSIAVVSPAIICPGMPAQFKVLSDAPGTRFSFGTGDTTDLKTVTYLYNQSGNYPLWAQATSLVGCRANWTGSVTVQPKPEAIPIVPDSVCSGASILLQGQQNGTGSCVFILPNGDTADGCTASYTFPQGGSFTISLIRIDALGCRDTAQAAIYVRQSPTPGFTQTILEPCTPAGVQFVSTATDATGLSWTTGDGGTYTATSFTHRYDSAGLWKVTQTATNEGFCPVSISKTLTIHKTPAFSVALEKYCTLAEGTDLSINTSFNNWVLVSNSVNQYSQAGTFHLGLEAGKYQIRIQSPEDCIMDSTITILPTNELQLWLKNQQDTIRIFLGESVDLAAQVNQTGVTFTWTDALGTLVGTQAETTVTPIMTGKYFVTAVNSADCIKHDTLLVIVTTLRDTVLVPNTFTPDNSGKNDIFRIRTTNTGIRKIRSFRIWDKWGELVYEQENFKPSDPHGWNGNFRGKKAEAGVYIYKILADYFDDFLDQKTGPVLLLR